MKTGELGRKEVDVSNALQVKGNTEQVNLIRDFLGHVKRKKWEEKEGGGECGG